MWAETLTWWPPPDRQKHCFPAQFSFPQINVQNTTIHSNYLMHGEHTIQVQEISPFTLTLITLLDYIFCTPIILANSTDSAMHLCPWSDHNMVTLSTSLIGLSDTPYTRRLNDSLLSDPITCQEMSTTIQEYFTINATPDMSPSTLWVAHKAVLRGRPISIASRKNKERWQQIYTLNGQTTQNSNREPIKVHRTYGSSEKA